MGKVILIIILANTGGAQNIKERLYFPTMEECMASLSKTIITPPIPNKDNAWEGAATCGYEDPSEPWGFGKKVK